MSLTTTFVTSNITCSAVRCQSISRAPRFMGQIIIIIIRPLRRMGVTWPAAARVSPLFLMEDFPFVSIQRGLFLDVVVEAL